MTKDAATALKRFGLGARPGELNRIASDPRGFVLASLSAPSSALIVDPALPPSHVVFAEAQAAQRMQKLAREMAREATQSGQMPADAAKGSPATSQPPGSDAAGAPKPGQIRRDTFREEAFARIHHARQTDAGFLERLVMFWSNHFCVSVSKGPVRGLAGAFEREAIRPHVLGKFQDMLVAVEQHPAMLLYLDNAQSIGPNSMAGLRNAKGLNENLAREILELHTLGVDGGYSQTDVTNLARLLTGWTVGGLDQKAVEPGRFLFAPNRHEPGHWSVTGKTYAATDAAGGLSCLADLAHHPSTARHIAAKLARHFVSDNPPSTLVSKLERTFRQTGGDLAAVARALAEAPEAWEPGPRKIIPPYDFALALARAFALSPPPQEILRLAAVLGQPLWQPPSPAGWPENDDAWMGPSPMRERLRIAEATARSVDRLADPRVVADDLLGSGLGDASRQAIARAETREQGFELLVMSPEFLRR